MKQLKVRNLRIIVLSLVTALLTFILVDPSAALAQWQGPTRNNFMIGRLQLGAEFSYPRCPCIRAVTYVYGAGGRVETKHFLITSPGLFQLRQMEVPDFRNVSQRIFRLGAAEALIKNWHLGLGFRADFGQNRDQGARVYRDIVAYMIVNLFRSQHFRLDIDTGARFLNESVNSGQDFERDQAFVAGDFNVRTNRIAANINVSYSPNVFFPEIDHSQFFSDATFRAEGSFSVRILSFLGFNMGMGLSAYYENDPFMQLVGYDPEVAGANVFIDLSILRSFGPADRAGP